MKFITFNKPKKTDLILIIVYVVLTFLLFINTSLNPNFNYNKIIILGYVIFSQVSIYSIFYRGFRNGYLVIIWVLIGIFHLFFWYSFQFKPQLHYERGFAGISLKYTLLLIGLFQVLRFLNLILFKRKLETVMFGSKSLFDERKLAWSDWFSWAIYYTFMIYLWT